MDEREAHADGQPAKAARRTFGRGAQDHDEEDGCQHDLRHHGGHQPIAAGGVFAIAVGGKAPDVCARLARGNEVQHGRCSNGAQHLGHHVARQLGRLEPAPQRQPYRHGRVEMPARDRPQRIGPGQHREAKGQGHADKTDTQLREGGSQHGAAATAKCQPERAEELSGPFFQGCGHGKRAPEERGQRMGRRPRTQRLRWRASYGV